MNVKEILEFSILKYKSLDITVESIVAIVILNILTRLILYILKKGLKNYQKRKSVDIGRIDAFYQLVKYVIWLFSILILFQLIGLGLTWLVAGSAALLVGVGMGIQNIFNDIVSGVIVLFEGVVDKGDILTIGDDMVGKVTQINIRTSHIVTRNNISVIVPNHRLVDENIINWSHNHKSPRFVLKVGVAYGSPTRKVKEILLEVAHNQKGVDITPEPFVRFKDFGDSSLDFELYFWSSDIMAIEDVISDMRFSIDDKFREESIAIPFPQRDIHIKQ